MYLALLADNRGAGSGGGGGGGGDRGGYSGAGAPATGGSWHGSSHGSHGGAGSTGGGGSAGMQDKRGNFNPGPGLLGQSASLLCIHLLFSFLFFLLLRWRFSLWASPFLLSNLSVFQPASAFAAFALGVVIVSQMLLFCIFTGNAPVSMNSHSHSHQWSSNTSHTGQASHGADRWTGNVGDRGVRGVQPGMPVNPPIMQGAPASNTAFMASAANILMGVGLAGQRGGGGGGGGGTEARYDAYKGLTGNIRRY